MVVRRTIEKLRARPKDERAAFAGACALAVVAILFVGWVVFFFRGLEATPAPNLQNVGSSLDSSGLQQVQQQFQQAYGSTTQFIDMQSSAELQLLGTSTQPTQ